MTTKMELLNKLRSHDNKVALQAVEALKVRGWLEDGSLRGVALCHAQLQGADLMKANLSTIDFHQAQMEWSDLSMANLTGAKLTRASLAGANLEKANLENADLYKTNLRYIRNLTDAQLAKAKRLCGAVMPDGKVSKPIEEEEKRLFARGSEIATRILTRAGCDPSTIFSTPPMGSNPSGTIRIGNLVDAHLRTDVAGLYVCDTSVLPEPDGLPPVLTIIALGKRLVAEELAAN